MVLPTERNVDLPLLKVLADASGPLPMGTAIDNVTKFFPKITQEDLASRLKDDRTSRWRNSVQWVRQRLVLNGELDGSVRGVWRITDKGKARLDREWSSWKPAYREASGASSGTIMLKRELLDEENPQEAFDDALDKLNENLETEILSILSDIDPPSFESIIGQLLERMRYGNPEVTGRSGDGGIDGTCSLDALGLVKLHFQAKRWKNQVGAKEIRDFIGGIQTSRGEYGIFVTTSQFTKDAIETAKKSGKVRLVDGHEMAKLMIEYGLGVDKTRVHVAKIDRDYFEGL